jgi:D-beta-D-heptose 7-phosphate kinase/D-beta-D-heptose 1-phosphate adenosyltransferase
MKDNIVIVTGGFDPIHSGHISYIHDAQNYGRVVVGVNSDEWLIKKKGQAFMPFEERINIVKNIKGVMLAIGFNDSDGSACDSISVVKSMFPKQKIIFANGGDRTKTNIPEMNNFKDDPQVEFKFGVGGENKKNSSSWILSEWKHPTENRVWGKFMTYYDSKTTKIKRLILEPGKSISMQYHENRNEFWFVEEGFGKITTLINDEEVLVKNIQKHDSYFVELKKWHRLENVGKDNLCIIEIQYGKECIEEDIIRKL